MPSTGTSHAYVWCVCAETMASMSGEAPVARSPNPSASAASCAQSLVAAPEWVSSTMTSGSTVSARSSATRFAASSWSPNSMSAMPEGSTIVAVSGVTVPMKATLTPSISRSAYSGSTGSVVPAA